MPTFLLTKEYKFIWEKDNARSATIVFSFDGGHYEFTRCDFSGLNTVYDLDDWEFLRELSLEIVKLVEKEVTNAR